MKAVLCSRNAHKLAELRAALPGWELELLDADAWPEETGSSYYENALAKARFGRELGGRDHWVLGEDSGIEVDALHGGPGIHSSRWSVRWIEELLERLEGAEDRRARYVCELVGLGPDGEALRGTGVLDGSIATEPRGREGFGYDPIFVPAGASRTVAELGEEWKRANSHRARAARTLLQAGVT
ncbi:MAG: non-canonical purine NTP pyrophosphatase [Actinobacteria bacterium]|nr:non-canonical purine NTP pyrophosphatase [Actinomycetota bacterium]